MFIVKQAEHVAAVHKQGRLLGWTVREEWVMDGWKDGWVDGWMDGWWMDDGWKDGCMMDVWVGDGLMDEWGGGRMNE